MGDCMVRVPYSRHEGKSIGNKRYDMPILGDAKPTKRMGTVCGCVSARIQAEFFKITPVQKIWTCAYRRKMLY